MSRNFVAKIRPIMPTSSWAYSNALRASGRVTALAPALSRCLFATSSIPKRPTVAVVAAVFAPTTVPRFFSSSSDDSAHEISATGTKLWNFEQMRKLAKDPKGVVIVDSREPSELAETGCIPSAINIPVATSPESFHISEEDFEDRYGYPRPGKDQEMVFYCKAGVRSRALAALAKDAGWSKVGEYPGSWLDWEKNGGEVQKGG